MQITPEVLHQYAETTVEKVTRENNAVLVAYLHGSLVIEDNPLLGGTADVDLVFIHSDTPEVEREIQRMTDDVHMDIAHHPQKEYRKGRELRTHPWMGPTIFHAKILHDPRHFMNFTQAAVRGLYHRSDNVIKRARPQAEHARQIWFSLQADRPEPDPEVISTYLRAVDHAVNSIASLTGPPLTERRFLLNFPARAEAVGRSGLYAGLLGLIGGPKVSGEDIQSMLPVWKTIFEDSPELQSSPRFHPQRLNYYLKAFEAIIGSGKPQDVLWPLLRTWTHAVVPLPAGHPAVRGWEEACLQLGLIGADFFERVDAFDAYLDMVEETLDSWAHEKGV
jgi:hypothetical protein